MDAMFGSGKSVSHGFRGSIKQLQFIIATKSQIKKYHYELDSSRPKNSQEHTAREPLALEPFSLAQFEQAIPRNFTAEPDKPRLAESYTGPFIIRLRSIGSFFGLRPELEVVTAEVKRLDKFLSVLKIGIDSVILKDQTQHRANEKKGARWHNLYFYKPYGKEYLYGQVWPETEIKADVEQIESLRGKIVLRAPMSISRLVLENVDVGQGVSMGDFSVVLAKLSREGFVLKGQSQKILLLGVEALNSENTLLQMYSRQVDPAEVGWKGHFSVAGVPSKIVLYVAGKYEEKQYPFKLTVKK